MRQTISQISKTIPLQRELSKKTRTLENKEVRLILKQQNGQFKELISNVNDTLLDIAQKNKLNIDGTCAGDLNCSTCHCVLDKKVYNSLPDSGKILEKERDLLEQSWGLQETSRLSCQVVVTEDMDNTVVEFPAMSNKEKYEPQIDPALYNVGTGIEIQPKQYESYTKSKIRKIMKRFGQPEDEALDILAMAQILPFRTNNYVIEEMIDWNNIPHDPLFQLTFPQKGMIWDKERLEIKELIKTGASRQKIREIANQVRAKLNPHPAKQQEMNVPQLDEGMVQGMQHKYRETVLFFPSESQYCHSYCTYCFRWAQFVGSEDLQFATNDLLNLKNYLRKHPSVKDILFTGGDPMVMKAHQLARYMDSIITDPELNHIDTIRIGTKSLSYWPYRYVTDDDADDTLRLFEKIVRSGKQISIMAHFTHWQELQTPVVQEAIRRIRMTGAQIRTQSPCVQHINDDPAVWTKMWNWQVKLGLVPYYMFVERDTGPREYFGLPLERVYQIYTEAFENISGLARTVRGPSMSATPGKVHVLGINEIAGEKVFILKFLQGRNPKWVNQPFFAKYDPKAQWLDQLKPAFGGDKFFWEDELAQLELAAKEAGSSGQVFQ